MTSTAQFEPIADPLSLSPVDFVSRARERGITLARDVGYFRRSREGNCGCYLGVAMVLAQPHRSPVGRSAPSALGIGHTSQTNGAMDGFDGRSRLHQPGDVVLYDTWYAKGRAVARAAGLEEGEGKP